MSKILVKENNDWSFETISGNNSSESNHEITITKIIKDWNVEYVQYYDPNFSELKKLTVNDFQQRCYKYFVFCETDKDDKYRIPDREKPYQDEENKNSPGIIVEKTWKSNETLRNLRWDFITYKDGNKTIVESFGKRSEITHGKKPENNTIDLKPIDKNWDPIPQHIPDTYRTISFSNSEYYLHIDTSKLSQKHNWEKNEVFNYFLPVVAIWTVADIVPLIWENRLLVKKWLDLINNNRERIPESLKWYLKFLNLKDVDSFHIWFVIWPRINAWWRIDSPYTSLKTLLYSGDKQIEYLEKLDSINAERKKMQEEAFKIAEKDLDHDQKILIAEHEDFHEWIVWIVSWRITEKYNKPSVVFKIDNGKWLAVWSLRWPDYFNVIEMLQQNWDILERFGWHKWAGWLCVKLENLSELKDRICEYCTKYISDDDLEKITYIDTKFYENERNDETIKKIDNLWPFGEWNPEPQYLFENIKIESIQKVWKTWNGHMKIKWLLWNKKIDFLFRWKWDMIKDIENKKEINIVWKIKKDDFNGWYSVNWTEIM